MANSVISNDPPYFLGIDVGGTYIKIGLVDRKGKILGDTSVSTDVEKGIEAGVKNIESAVKSLLKKTGFTLDHIYAIGIVSSGTIDTKSGKVIEAHNLPSWQNQPIRDIISSRFGKPTAIQNDANAAALGEFWAGAGQGSQLLLVWTIGTGVGSGIVIDGKIVSGSHFQGGECGHIIIEYENGRLCSSGQRGTLEAYVGGKSIVTRTIEQLEKGTPSLLQNDYKNGDQISPLQIMNAAEQGDKLATEIIVDTAKYLAAGTVTMMHALDPDIILIGGAVNFGRDETKSGKLFIETLRAEVKKRCFVSLRDLVKIEWAKLGSDAGFVGAAACACREFYRE